MTISSNVRCAIPLRENKPAERTAILAIGAGVRFIPLMRNAATRTAIMTICARTFLILYL